MKREPRDELVLPLRAAVIKRGRLTADQPRPQGHRVAEVEAERIAHQLRVARRRRRRAR